VGMIAMKRKSSVYSMYEIIVFLLVVVSLCNSLNIDLQNAFNLEQLARFFSNGISSFAVSPFSVLCVFWANYFVSQIVNAS